jgi:hypothetical protein
MQKLLKKAGKGKNREWTDMTFLLTARRVPVPTSLIT